MKDRILAALADRPNQSGAELSKRLGALGASIYQHLHMLEYSGQIVCTRWNEHRYTYRLVSTGPGDPNG